MSAGKVILEGLDNLLKLFTSWLKTPEERELYEAQAQRERSEAHKIEAELATNAIKEVAETQSINIKNINDLYELYKKLGYTDEEIRELVKSKTDKILQIDEDIEKIKYLARKGVIVDAKVREIKE